MIPPTIHTQGAAYHSVCWVVVVVLMVVPELLPVLSCPQADLIRTRVRTLKNTFQKISADLFIIYII
jgi:hypothetical protein